jgi:hypothetical protein
MGSILEELQKDRPNMKIGTIEELGALEEKAPEGGETDEQKAEKERLAEEARVKAEADKDKNKTPEAPDKLKIFSEYFGQEFKSEDELTAYKDGLLTSKTKAEESETAVKTAKEEAEKLIAEAEETFLKKYNLNDDVLKMQLLRKEFPDMPVEIAEALTTKDFMKTYKEDPIDVLVTKFMIDNPEIDDYEIALAKIYRDHGIDAEDKDEKGIVNIDKDKMLDLTIEAKKSAKEIDAMKEKVKLPERTNIVAKKEAETKEQQEKTERIKTQWEPFFKNFADTHLAKIPFTREITDESGKKVSEVFFEFEVPDDYRKKVGDVLKKAGLENFAKGGIEHSKEAEKKLEKQLEKDLLGEAMKEFAVTAMIALGNAKDKQWADQDYYDNHNPRAISGKVNPEGKKLTQKEKDHAKSMDELGKRMGMPANQT